MRRARRAGRAPARAAGRRASDRRAGGSGPSRIRATAWPGGSVGRRAAGSGDPRGAGRRSRPPSRRSSCAASGRAPRAPHRSTGAASWRRPLRARRTAGVTDPATCCPCSTERRVSVRLERLVRPFFAASRGRSAPRWPAASPVGDRPSMSAACRCSVGEHAPKAVRAEPAVEAPSRGILGACVSLSSAVAPRSRDGIQEVEGSTPFGSTLPFARPYT